MNKLASHPPIKWYDFEHMSQHLDAVLLLYDDERHDRILRLRWKRDVLGQWNFEGFHIPEIYRKILLDTELLGQLAIWCLARRL